MKHTFTITQNCSDGRALVMKGEEFLGEVAYGAPAGNSDGHMEEVVIGIDNTIHGKSAEVRMSGATWRAIEGLCALWDFVQLAIIQPNAAKGVVDLVERTSGDTVFLRIATMNVTDSCMHYSADGRNNIALPNVRDAADLRLAGLWEQDDNTHDAYFGDPAYVEEVGIAEMIHGMREVAERVYRADILEDRLNAIAGLAADSEVQEIATAHQPVKERPVLG